MTFRKANLVTGWSVFLVSTIVYVLTIEPTTSFWDCGEFITTAYKLEIGHPPGAPLFMLLGRVFSAFVPLEVVPVTINILSALSSSFTILFLFWTITHFGYKMAAKDGGIDSGKLIAIMASGTVGALAFTFSDSFWFSAVEGEVYAMSSLFTAAVFWAILRWESLSDGKNEMRWIIAISYLIGLSIGVHLLNLLAIPAMCFVVYFKRYEPSTKGIIWTGLISLLILGFIQAGIIPGVVSLAGKFELLFVNSMGLPFNTGVIVYAVLAIGLLVFGLYYTHKHNHPVLNTIVLSIVVIIMGYSTFATIVIRSSANPPLDENNPENVFTLLSYLNREQYGDRPLAFGQYWNSPQDRSNARADGKPVYAKAYVIKNKGGRTVQWFSTEFDAKKYLAESDNPGYTIEDEYVISADGENSVVRYDPKFTAPFPRMYSSQESHVEAYKQWSNYKGTPIRTTGSDGEPTIINKPTMGENLRFFFRYQVNWMYWRYFMWNFSGRQNDVQGQGDLLNGNWLSGVNFIDNERLASQDNLPGSFKENFAYNKFFMLPFLLGLIGFIYLLYKRPDDWFVSFLLFLLTGIAVVIYLNQTPYQPRERDYAYAGSFYAFAIWIGLGVYALFDAAFSINKRQLSRIAMYSIGAGAVIYAFEAMGNNSHFFSYSVLYLSVIGVVLFAVFYAIGQSVKNSVVIATLAALVTLPVPILMAADGWNDHDRSDRYTARDFAANYLESCEPNSILFTNGDNDTFPLWYAQEVEGIRTDVRVVNLSLLNTDWYINQMKRKAYESDPLPFSLEETKYRQGTRDVVFMDESSNQKKTAVDVGRAISFIANDNNMRSMGGDKVSILPTKSFYVPVDKENVVANGTVSETDTANIVDRVEWRINRSYLLKNNLMQLDLLATNDWERKIYFAVTTGPDSYINLDEYFKLVGLAYQLVPIKSPKSPNPNMFGSVNTERMYENVMEKFKWGGMDSEDEIYMDENNIRMTNNIRLQFANLAEQLIEEEKIDKAKKTLDKCVEVMPNHNVPFDRLMVPIIQNYYRVGEDEKANEILGILFDKSSEEFEYFMSTDVENAVQLRQDIQMSYQVMQRLHSYVTQAYPQEELGEKIDARFEEMDKMFDAKIQEMEAYRVKESVKF
ncbi:MAG: DUF2723 domain-containing protein [Cryomorphaceae bacterium]|nr:DUF2723 domain-containing protein [Flavobacteriales bacterium]